MKIVINAYNTLSAGTSIVSRQLLEMLEEASFPFKVHIIIPHLKIFRGFKNSESVHIARLPVFWWIFKYLFRFVFEFFILPTIILIKKADVVLIMANYSPLKLKPRKIVFMQYSCLVEEDTYTETTFKGKMIEILRQFIFRWTVNSSDNIIVQTEYMKRLLKKKYETKELHIHVLSNPISKDISSNIQSMPTDEKITLYVSRYYPHKNHEFILKLAQTYTDILEERNIKIYITVDPNTSLSAKRFIKSIQTLRLGNVITNIGEIDQEEINSYYQRAFCLFFPSKTESFGNALVEAMYQGLPVLVPELGYSQAICGEAGYYYTPDNIEDALQKLLILSQNLSVWQKYSKLSHEQASKFPTMEQWFKQLLTIINMGLQR